VKRRNWVIFTLICLIAIGFISSEDCQYTVKESYQELELGLYDSSGNYFGQPLEFKDFVSGGMNIAGCSPPSFKIYNPLKEDLTLNLTYRIDWNAPLGARSQNYEATISINSYSNSEKIVGTCLDIGSGEISPESISYTLTSPEIITLKNEQVTKQREICQKCGNSDCWNDGASCNPLYDDSKCGSGICNIASFCGKTKVVDCPDGQLNCNDKICLEPSTKEFNEAYMCDFECKSDRSENGVCLESSAQVQKGKDERMRNIVIFLVLAVISAAGLSWYLAVRKRGVVEGDILGLTEDKGELEKLIDQRKREIQELQDLIDQKRKEIRKLEDSLKKGKDILDKLKIDIKNAEGKAKEELEKQLKKEEERQKDRLDKLKIEKDILLKEKTKYNRLLEERDKLAEEVIKNTQKEIDAALKKYTRICAGKGIFYDEKSGYIKFSDSGTPIHTYIYKKELGVGTNQEVHHIDKDKLNNELWNLIAIDEKKHSNLHGRIEFQNWESGIEELKRIGMKESQFHKYIRAEIEKRKQQKLFAATS
jgi:hypothetical protein